jgi:hypothetical protein
LDELAKRREPTEQIRLIGATLLQPLGMSLGESEDRDRPVEQPVTRSG